MRTRLCSVCNTEQPQNNTLSVDGQLYCGGCLDTKFPDEGELKEHQVVHEPDPTICSKCGHDAGEAELKKISRYHVCQSCDRQMREKAFPAWVKLFLGGVAAITIFGFFWNWKYYEAYKELNAAFAASGANDFEQAAALMESVNNKVPEVNDISSLAHYFRAVDYVTKDQNDKAIAEFMPIRNSLPADYGVNELLLRAELGDAFDHKDYHHFLDRAAEQLKMDTSNMQSMATMASAYSCLYVTEHADSSRLLMEGWRQKVESLDTAGQLSGYLNMIDYRISTGEILDLQQFEKKFPNGWSQN